MDITRPTVLEVDLDAFEYNVMQIQKYVGNDVKLMPVIKANAYGTYINKRLDIINKFDIVAVAIVDEAVELRKLGYNKEIFVLNQPYIDEVDKIIKYNITIGVSSNSFLQYIGNLKETVKVHLEIGTGMGRTGINPNRVEEYIQIIKQFPNIKLEGIYTHLSVADYNEEYTNKQLISFKKSINKAEEFFGKLKYVHCCASNGILNYKESAYNLVRPGIILYGYESFDKTMQKIDLKPVCKLKSTIIYIKEVETGFSIGYGRSYITSRKTKVATVPIGYADGLRRALSNKGEVIVHNKRVPIIGKICMDSFMIDVTDLENVTIGDEVYIWDNNIITLEEISKLCDTINYEVMCTISNRVPRVFKK